MGSLATAIAADAPAPSAPEPRTLVLAVDGVPFRVLEKARRRGAFDDWGEPARMVAPFPSLTNVSFAAMLAPFGVAQTEGYEVHHFDRSRNEVVRARPFNYDELLAPWRQAFDVTGRTVGSKLSVYTSPKKKLARELEATARAVLATERSVVMAHVGSTDAMQHLAGDKALVRVLVDLDRWIADLRRAHARERGRPLRVVLLSDHGNSERKIHGAGGFRRKLRDCELEVTWELDDPNDVVAVTFGMVGYGALYLDHDRARTAAEALTDHDAVALAAWYEPPSAVGVAGGGATARIEWRDGAGGRRYRYVADGGDPLGLVPVAEELALEGRLDPDGFAADDLWFAKTLRSHYPDAMGRLARAFTTDPVRNRANVLFSLEPGFAWGWQSAQASSWLRGGRLEGTHGGLDAESTLGFVVSTDPSLSFGDGVRARDVLEPLRVEIERALRPTALRAATAAGP
jgi:hypothetical protein